MAAAGASSVCSRAVSSASNSGLSMARGCASSVPAAPRSSAGGSAARRRSCQLARARVRKQVAAASFAASRRENDGSRPSFAPRGSMLRPMSLRSPPWRSLAPSIVLLLSTAAAAATPALPASGRDALEAMRAAYAGRWYTTLTFVQKTRKPAPDGKETVETWFESLRHTDGQGTQLRIDVTPLSDGNGVLYSASRTRRFKAGKQVSLTEGGN